MNEINQTQDNLLLNPQQSAQEKQISLFKGQVLLNPSISKLNFFCFLLFNISLGLIMIPTDLFQASVLGLVYKLDTTSQSTVTSIVQFSQLIIQLLFSSLLGYVCDKYGRKILISSGLIIVCCTIFLTPNFPGPYPYYILNQCIQSFGVAAASIPPLLADYVHSSTQGRVSGITSALTFAGSLIMTSVDTDEQDTVTSLHKKFFFMAILATFLSLVIIYGTKGGSYHKKEASSLQERASITDESQEIETQQAPPPQIQSEVDEPGLMAGIKEGKNPWIFTGYVVNFLMTSTLGLPSFILVQYVAYLTQDETKANLAYALVNKYYLSALIFSIFFGVVVDKFNKFKLNIMIIICSIISLTLLILIKSPTEPLAYVSMIFFGTASSGYLIFSDQLLCQYSSPQFRGSVMAFATIVSLGGTVTINILGVYLLKWNILIPFFICLSTSILALIMLIILYIFKKDVLNKN